MEDVLVLRDAAWALRYVGWSILFLIFIAPLKPRFSRQYPDILAALLLTVITASAQYSASITLLYDTLLRVACWVAVCLLLKRTDWRNALYGALSFAVLEDCSKIISHDMLFAIYWNSLFVSNSPIVNSIIYSLLNIAVAMIAVYLIRELIFASDKRKFTVFQLLLILAPSVVYFYARDVQFVLLNYNPAAEKELMLKMYSLLLLFGFCDLLISILADNNLSTRIQQQELHHMQRLMAKQQQEFLSQKAASEAVNQKYHDLKNCLLSLQAEEEGSQSSPVREQLSAEIEAIMKPIAANLETGNEYLSVILSEKIQLCQEKGIRLTPYVDGRNLGFISGLDLCVLTGNALDNCIEASSALPEELREIHVNISSAHGVASFTFQNYYDGPLRIDRQGSILTNKKDSQNHGYGLKGIRQIVEKYEGAMNIDAQNGQFVLSIVLPLPELTGETPSDPGGRY